MPTTKMLEVSKSKPVNSSTDMSLQVASGEKLSLMERRTTVTLLTACCMWFDATLREWQTMFHTGVLCSDNRFKVRRTYKFCLIHSYSDDKDRSGTKTDLCFSNDRDELKKILKETFISGESSTQEQISFYVKQFGSSTTPLSELAQLTTEICRSKFDLAGIKRGLSADDRKLVKKGTTNCLHSSLKILDVMTSNANNGCKDRFNNLCIKLLTKCFEQALDNWEEIDAKSKPLMFTQAMTVYRYKHGVDNDTRKRTKQLIKKLLETDPYLKSFALAVSAFCSTNYRCVETDTDSETSADNSDDSN